MKVFPFYMLCVIAAAAAAPADCSIYTYDSLYPFDAPLDVAFNFYSRQKQDFSQVLSVGVKSSFFNSDFMVNKPVAILVHGMNGDAEDEFNRHIRKAIFNKMDINVISVDWCIGTLECYEESFENIPSTAMEIVKFINWLKDLGVKHSDLRLVGFSMGAQLVGFVARGMEQKLPYIMALDPAAQLFEDSKNTSLNATDADYVEVIHTSLLGITRQAGHNDFYPNGGNSQIGCTEYGCNRFRSYQYLAESLTIGDSRFIAQYCTSVEEAMAGSCNGSRQLAMGGLEPKQKIGILYLETNPSPPFAKG